jgi:hypothetical protein
MPSPCLLQFTAVCVLMVSDPGAHGPEDIQDFLAAARRRAAHGETNKNKKT